MSEPIEYAFTNTGVFSSHNGTNFTVNATANVTAGALGNSVFITSNLIMIGNSTVFNTLNSTAWTGFATANVSLLPVYGMMENNIVINGGMEVSQINGTTGLTVGAITYQVDQWQVAKTGTMVCTAQQVTDAPPGYNNSIKVTVGTAESSLGSGDNLYVVQSIEGFRISKLTFGNANAQTVTLGFWTKIHRIGNYSGSLRNFAATRSYPFTFTQNVADTWEYKTVIIPGDVTGTWIGNTTAASLNVYFSMAAGTSLVGTVNTWAASNFIGATGTTNGVAAISDIFQITGVTLLPGSLTIPQAMAPNFIRSFDTELFLCQRFWESSYGYGVAPGTNIAAGCVQTMNGTDGNQVFGSRFRVAKRASPSITIYSKGGTSGSISDTSFTDSASGFGANDPNEYGYRCLVNGGGLPGGKAYTYHYVADARF
jgi:hypothetical protein